MTEELLTEGMVTEDVVTEDVLMVGVVTQDVVTEGVIATLLPGRDNPPCSSWLPPNRILIDYIRMALHRDADGIREYISAA
jgi:hypothetical protein